MSRIEANASNRIESNPQVMLGKPVFRSTRIPVYVVLDLLSAGAFRRSWTITPASCRPTSKRPSPSASGKTRVLRYIPRSPPTV